MDIVLGLQWGDEGKGKFIDLISENYDITARFNVWDLMLGTALKETDAE